MTDFYIVDQDGTIADTYDSYAKSTIDVVNENGMPMSEKNLTGDMIAFGVDYTLRHFLGDRDDIVDLRLEIGKRVIKNLELLWINRVQ